MIRALTALPFADFTDFTVPRHDLPMDLQLHLNNIALSEILNDKIREFEMYSAAGGRELAKLPRGRFHHCAVSPRAAMHFEGACSGASRIIVPTAKAHVHLAGTKVDLEAGKVSRENYAYLYDYPWYTLKA